MNFVQPIRDRDTIEAIKRYLLSRNKRDYILFTLGINIGLRISDLLKLKVKDVKGDYITIREQKTKKERRSIINRSTKVIIDEYIKTLPDDEAYLFPSRKGYSPIRRETAYKIIKDTCNQFGISNTGTHTLRKTFGYHFYKETKDVATLQTILNHADPKITLRYIGIEQDGIDTMMNKFKL